MRDNLRELLEDKSYMTGNFVLSSGKTSKYYLDCRQTTLNHQGIYLISQRICDILFPTVVGVGGLTLGADPIIAGVVLYSRLDFEFPNPINGFIVRKKIKDHGTTQQIEGLSNFQRGDDVAIVDDVVTSGGSILAACQAAEENNLNVVQTICIVDRLEGGYELLREHGYVLESLFLISDLSE